jgi:hypothetical protein
LPTEDQQRQAKEYIALGMPTLADSVLRPWRHRVTRPEWQKRVLHVVSPAWHRKERRVAEFQRLVAMASRSLEREEAGPQAEAGTQIVSTPGGDQ